MNKNETSQVFEDASLSRYSYECWTRSEADSLSVIPYKIGVPDVLKVIIDNELTECEKTVITMHYFENKKISQIANELCVNPSTVTRTVFRAERKIEKFMKYALFVMNGKLP